MKSRASMLILLTLSGAPAFAGLSVLGQGDNRTFDPSGFPPEMQKSFRVMDVKCAVAQCHGMGRTVEAITTGIAPISNTPFDKDAAKKYGVKMMRMPNSGLDKAEAKEMVELMYFLLDEAGK